MSEQPTDPQARIEAIKQRLEKATPGQWEWQAIADDWPDAYIGLAAMNNAGTAGTYIVIADVSAEPVMINENDAALITHAPGDLRFLLDEIDRLETLVSDLQSGYRGV